MRRPTENPHERESPSTTRGDVVRAAWTHTATCVFCLTIFFNDSIQLTNCDEMMSQCSMTNGRENRNNGNQEEGNQEGSEEEKEVAAFHPTRGARKRPLSIFRHADGRTFSTSISRLSS